ncbi:hypothetical protein M068_1527 [Bacteroides fragilis str. J38-1]|nr:hypothetical protein M068_1527 [Bacteroides fragilis str. J38-1]
MFEVHGNTGIFIGALSTRIVRDYKVLLVCNGLRGREPGYLLCRIVYTNSTAGSLRGVGEERKRIVWPIVSRSSCPVSTVVSRSDRQVCEKIGAVTDGRHVECSQVLQVCHVGTGYGLIQRGTERNAATIIYINDVIVGTRGQDCYSYSRK